MARAARTDSSTQYSCESFPSSPGPAPSSALGRHSRHSPRYLDTYCTLRSANELNPMTPLQKWWGANR